MKSWIIKSNQKAPHTWLLQVSWKSTTHLAIPSLPKTHHTPCYYKSPEKAPHTWLLHVFWKSTTHLAITITSLLKKCGTCHMASFFSALPGTTTAVICSSSNLLVATSTQHLASHPTSGSLLTTSSPLPSTLTVTSHLRSEGTNAFSSSSSYLHSWCIPHNLHSVTKSPVWRLSLWILQAISYSSDHPKPLKIFYCRNEVLATNNISMASAPHQRC